jgi:hypothetical protein
MLPRCYVSLMTACKCVQTYLLQARAKAPVLVQEHQALLGCVVHAANKQLHPAARACQLQLNALLLLPLLLHACRSSAVCCMYALLLVLTAAAAAAQCFSASRSGGRAHSTLPREVNVSSTSGGYWWGTYGITPQPEIAGVLQCSSELTGRVTARQ